MHAESAPFRLKQKLEEDALGEVYCAECPGDEEADQASATHVLVRLFRPDGLDPERFMERIGARRHLVGTQLGEQMTTSRFLGVADGRAYDAVPYVSGRSLLALVDAATKQRETFPLEVALYVAGRLATGLGVAFRQQIEGECLVHGFIVPHLVRVSEEGHVSLGGLEVAPALGELRGTASTFAQLLPYLAPERRLGAPLHPTDDVYSLGALLYQLLTLRMLASAEDIRAASEIPAELRYFLARSVAERSRRIGSVVEWLRELKALAVQEGWTASRTDLSAFLAEVDERLKPIKPDSTEISAEDRKKYARMIREARAGRAAALKAAASTNYETSEIVVTDLKPLVTEGRLVKTSHVKRASDSLI